MAWRSMLYKPHTAALLPTFDCHLRGCRVMSTLMACLLLAWMLGGDGKN